METNEHTEADVIIELRAENKHLRGRLFLGNRFQGPHEDLSDCPAFCDGCHCTVETLVHNIQRADKLQAQKKKAIELLEKWYTHSRSPMMSIQDTEECINDVLIILKGRDNG